MIADTTQHGNDEIACIAEAWGTVSDRVIASISLNLRYDTKRFDRAVQTSCHADAAVSVSSLGEHGSDTLVIVVRGTYTHTIGSSARHLLHLQLS